MRQQNKKHKSKLKTSEQEEKDRLSFAQLWQKVALMNDLPTETIRINVDGDVAKPADQFSVERVCVHRQNTE